MDETEPPKKRRFSVARAIAVLAALAVLIGVSMHFLTSPRASNQQVYDNLEVFGTRLQNLENSIILHEKRIKEL